jgi:hypothetical protein
MTDGLLGSTRRSGLSGDPAFVNVTETAIAPFGI